jgi:hypothetical protein
MKGLTRLLLFLALLMTVSSLAKDANAQATRATFSLFPQNAPLDVLNCLQKSPNTPPTATVTVVKGKLNDTLTIKLRNVKPNTGFDLFTVENTPFLADGSANGSFPAGNFGLAWYQSDIQTNSAGAATVTIRTILVNQIFGFDAGTGLTPVNTFNVGFWFNDPNDAAACGFNVANPTPFNGEHAAGPMAMISGQDATTGLGQLCLDPNTSNTPATCNP